MTTHHAAAEIGVIARYLAPRRKAIAGFLVPLLTGLLGLAAAGDLDWPHLAGLLGTAISTGGVVHQVRNTPGDRS